MNHKTKKLTTENAKERDLLKELIAKCGTTCVTHKDKLNAGYKFIEENGLSDRVDGLLHVLDWLEDADDLALLFAGTPNTVPLREPSFSSADKYKLDRVYRHLENFEESTDHVEAADRLVPRWVPSESKCGVLYLGDKVVKEFKCPAKNQTDLIEEFAKQGWKTKIENPLKTGAALRHATEILKANQYLIEFGTFDLKRYATWSLRE